MQLDLALESGRTVRTPQEREARWTRRRPDRAPQLSRPRGGRVGVSGRRLL